MNFLRGKYGYWFEDLREGEEKSVMSLKAPGEQGPLGLDVFQHPLFIFTPPLLPHILSLSFLTLLHSPSPTPFRNCPIPRSSFGLFLIVLHLFFSPLSLSVFVFSHFPLSLSFIFPHVVSISLSVLVPFLSFSFFWLCFSLSFSLSTFLSFFSFPLLFSLSFSPLFQTVLLLILSLSLLGPLLILTKCIRFIRAFSVRVHPYRKHYVTCTWLHATRYSTSSST